MTKDISKDKISPVEDEPKSKLDKIKEMKEKVETEGGKISVTKKQLSDILSTIDTLKKSNEFLVGVADKRAVAHWYQRHKESVPPKVMIRTLEVADEEGNLVEKVVTGWRSIEDKVWKDPQNGQWKELQTCEVIFSDGTTLKMHQVEFARQYKNVDCKRIGVIEDEETKQTAFKLVRIDNGEEYTIGVQFVN